MNKTKGSSPESVNFHKEHRKRIKKKFAEKGLSVFEEHEILELILFYAIARKDTNELAHKLIDKFGSLRMVLEADIAELCKVSGIGTDSATLIKFGRIPTRCREEAGKRSKDRGCPSAYTSFLR